MAEQDGEKTQETQDLEVDVSVEDSSEEKEEEKETVNDAIRKQRLTMNLSIEKISKDLRISKSYVQAIENGDYSAIPAEPYIRVYVKTIAEYLSLDSDELLKQLAKERNNQKDTDLNISAKSVVDVSETKAVKISQDNRNKKFATTAGLIILLLIMVYFLANSSQKGVSQSRTDDFTETIIHDEQVPDDSASNFLPDSLLRGDTILGEKEPVPSVEMSFRVLRDSAWVEIIADGKLFQNGKIIRGPSKNIEASAFDSINIYVGASAVVEISVNGKTIDKTGATGVWKFTKDSVKVLSPTVWGRIRKVSQ